MNDSKRPTSTSPAPRRQRLRISMPVVRGSARASTATVTASSSNVPPRARHNLVAERPSMAPPRSEIAAVVHRPAVDQETVSSVTISESGSLPRAQRVTTQHTRVIRAIIEWQNANNILASELQQQAPLPLSCGQRHMMIIGLRNLRAMERSCGLRPQLVDAETATTPAAEPPEREGSNSRDVSTQTPTPVEPPNLPGPASRRRTLRWLFGGPPAKRQPPPGPGPEEK